MKSCSDSSTGDEAYSLDDDLDAFSNVLPIAHRLSYMRALLFLRPQTFVPLSPCEESNLLSLLSSEGASDGSQRVCATANLQDNPFVRRIRRRLLLRQTKRTVSGKSTSLFCLESRIRQMLQETKPGQLCLSDLFPRKVIQNYLQELPHEEIASAVHSGARKKGRRSKDYQVKVDSTRAQNRKLRSCEQQTNIDAILRKHERVKRILQSQRQQIENEIKSESLAIQNYAAPWPQSPENEEPSLQNSGVVSEGPQEIPRCCPSSVEPSDSSVDKRPRPNYQTREICDRIKAIALHSSNDGAGSAEMRQHLLRTVGHVETVFDPSLDPAGRLWSFEEQIFGDIHNKRANTPIISLWSRRVIKPIIWRDYETEPPKLKLLLDIQRRAMPPHLSPAAREPIQYKYLRPHMLPQIKKLLQDLLWPNIDVSESLLYPEHTVVALYRELVVGCGFVTNFGYITYVCVHPEWQRSGIGTFMLYHLIQTCPHKDITLHVSANNSAVVLYQKFGFKIDEYVVNFYEKFLASQSSLSKDALFMRLRK
ncbi:uncharacterized protein LOC126318447 isoform X2 [Schistocerca gregaria]|uniref:uncharacterized protein LOC126318447 isoform X2 n=1 Tax=Schistocerca gregaria TaxID=7010 RepID=UPI00211F3C24|nr:uncharacterized protein LOC126318447 isoform X2 [Schistocerca gregaria]